LAAAMPKSLHRPEHKLFMALLRDMRRHAGLTQEVLAEKLKRPQTFVSAVERGRVRQDFLQLRDWCGYCGTTVARLADDFEEKLTIRKNALKRAREARAAKAAKSDRPPRKSDEPPKS